jgi:uncharacterized damage-inducible protein DinB
VLGIVQDLVRHKVWANASLAKAIRRHDAAAADGELRTLLHHIMVADRFWFALNRGEAFDAAAASAVPARLDDVIAQLRQTHEAELRWVAALDERALQREVETPYIPGHRYTTAQAILQVCLHSHGHRSQAATRLRSLGGTPPPTDYVVWLRGRPSAAWD